MYFYSIIYKNVGDTQNATSSAGNISLVYIALLGNAIHAQRYIDGTRMKSPPFISELLNNNTFHV